jgi:hypothetical protein
MSGVLTYNSAYRVQSADCGYAVLQAGVQGYLTTAIITAATSAQDLIDAVNAAVVAPGAESFSQRNSIARAIQEGSNLGDFSATRVQSATTPLSLAELTWADSNPAIYNGYLGPNLLP